MGFWDKSPRVFKCLRDNGHQSIRQLAQQIGLAKNRVHRLPQAMERRHGQPKSWGWETEDGRCWLRRLVVATLYPFGLKRCMGMDTISRFFWRLCLETQVGCSPSALRGVMAALVVTIEETARGWEQDGVAPGEGREMIGAVDETCLAQMILVFQDVSTGYLVQAAVADDRTYARWKALGEERLQALGTRGLYVVRDRAKALMQLAAKGLECLSMSDFFHLMHEIVKNYSLALGQRVRQAHRDHAPAALDPADGQHHQVLAQGRRVAGPGQLGALPPAHYPAQQGCKASLDAQGLTLGTPFALGVIVPCAQLLAHRLPVALHPLSQQVTHRGQGTRVDQHHAEAPQRQHGGLGLAEMGQMVHDRCPPLVEPGLAQHGFPPYGCGSLHTAQYVVRREVHHLLFKKPRPVVGGACEPPGRPLCRMPALALGGNGWAAGTWPAAPGRGGKVSTRKSAKGRRRWARGVRWSRRERVVVPSDRWPRRRWRVRGSIPAASRRGAKAWRRVWMPWPCWRWAARLAWAESRCCRLPLCYGV